MGQNADEGAYSQRGQLSIQYLPPRPQAAFDEMLWACDLNLVRGEDSLVRALWAGEAFVWQIYPQHDDAHHSKLYAFLDWLEARPRCGAFMRAGTASPARKARRCNCRREDACRMARLHPGRTRTPAGSGRLGHAALALRAGEAIGNALRACLIPPARCGSDGPRASVGALNKKAVNWCGSSM